MAANSAAPAAAPPAPPTTPAVTQPFAPLNTINTNQIQASQSKSLGGLFFTVPGATSAGLAPGAQRPVLRGLDDFRVRVQENGVDSMDVSVLGQDHGVPMDPLAIQKVEILRGPDALRYGMQATGGIVDATNNRIPSAAPRGGWAAEILGATTTGDDPKYRTSGQFLGLVFPAACQNGGFRAEFAPIARSVHFPR